MSMELSRVIHTNERDWESSIKGWWLKAWGRRKMFRIVKLEKSIQET